MIEVHPFGDFVPPSSKRLLLGSFTVKPFEGYEWFYSSPRNQFWQIMEGVYGKKFAGRSQKEYLMKKLQMVVSDVIYSCERLKGNNSDTNLVNITYNTRAIVRIIEENPIEKIYFTSRWVESIFKREISHNVKLSQIELIYLPSPSPRNARMSLSQKIGIYKKLLPSKYL